MFYHGLRRAEHMPCRCERHINAVYADDFAEFCWLALSREVLAIARRHDVDRFWCCEHGAVSGAGMVGMAMCDDGAINGANRIDVKITDRAIKARWGGVQKLVR